jgi:hypothetical protein
MCIQERHCSFGDEVSFLYSSCNVSIKSSVLGSNSVPGLDSDRNMLDVSKMFDFSFSVHYYVVILCGKKIQFLVKAQSGIFLSNAVQREQTPTIMSFPRTYH